MERDICIYPKNSESIPISSLSANVDPMTYPLMFPSGDPGWTVNIKHIKGNRNVTPLQFYMYRLSYRGTFNPCLALGKLTQQYIVDIWSKVEGERLKYIRLEQKKLRAEMYCGLMDYVNNKVKEENVRPGKIVILPSTFTGGPRSYQQSFMDAMRLVQEFGRPDLFITMTCNPKWCEIRENLLDCESASDRPDIVARVFRRKVQELMKEIKDEEIFGPVIAFVYVIEFQKRGLPHVHFITFLSEKIRDTETVDKIICAEIPDEIKNPELFNIVKQFQVHGPCGNQNINSPCMDSEKKICTKYYPKPFCSETSYHSKNYPEYRRRKDGKQIIFYNKDGSIKCIADNSMIVPYNPYLSKKFECHITVMVCSSTGGIKYLFKYCYKGHDCAFIVYKDDNQEMQYDEIQYYLNTRYVCPPEAMHRLYEFPMHEQSHATYRLAVHLPNQQSICFQEGLEEEAVNKFKNTTLTAWFKLNAEDSEARKYLYTEIPHNYVFVESSKTWKVRQRITKTLICRMYFVSPKDIERYFLRLLLLYVRGAKSFEDIKTYEGITYNTFTEAARARNLMVDDNEWNNCLTEAVSMKFPKELCRLFAYICVFGSPVNAIDLWNKYKEDMIFENDLPVEVSIQKSLILINEVFSFHGFSLHQFGLPHINQKVFDDYNSVSKENSALELQLLKIKSDCLIKSLNDDQRNVFNDIMMAVHNDNCSNRYIYLDGPGGSGKSYLHNTIITTVESEGLVVLSVAWTGIAANLLKGGRTAPSMFKFPIPINEDSTCNISGMSKHSELLRSAKIIIWDEITMAPKYALQAMEVMLRDITKCKKPFGGKVILLSGDFRQILPIVPHGSRTHIVEVCVKNSKLWHLFQTRSLHVNVRLNNNQINFSNWLLNVGDGKHQSTFEKKNNVLEIPQDLISNGNLIEEIYGSSISSNDVSAYSSCILSLTNSEVLDMNDRILSNSEGNEVVYYSIDSHVDEDQKDINNIVPVEILNSLTPDGLPPHRLSLKEGCIIMLLRNMNLVQGLCNGTRLVVKSLLRNVISAEIIVGKSKGEIVFIPRIDLSPSQELEFICQFQLLDMAKFMLVVLE
ncbi:uncharacterized protein LOC127289553 [Leptopilina boulardi]|uniref:uncharacterized protein LOC127289553 n=1 Tax=Leptopilina boulardi TaxID=63433 RepID=UPI0021F50662|nr:uncharacterized protein LOC127289553 [Leptopilina boulardi]